MKILKPQSQPSNPGPSDFFTGAVRVTPLIQVGRPRTSMTHFAIQEALNGKVVEWMEKVSDEDYGAMSSS